MQGQVSRHAHHENGGEQVIPWVRSKEELGEAQPWSEQMSWRRPKTTQLHPQTPPPGTRASPQL